MKCLMDVNYVCVCVCVRVCEYECDCVCVNVVLSIEHLADQTTHNDK